MYSTLFLKETRKQTYSGIKSLEEAYESLQEQEILKKISRTKLELNEIINKKNKILGTKVLAW